MSIPDVHLHALARRRARAKLGWFTHAAVYLAVNTGLIAMALATGRHWAIYPLLSWGLGLLLHGVAVWHAGLGGALLERMVDKELGRLTATPTRRGDKW